MITIGFFNTPRTTGSIAAIFIPLLSAEKAPLLNKFRNIVIMIGLARRRRDGRFPNSKLNL